MTESTEQLERKLQSLPKYSEALETVRRLRKLVSRGKSILSPKGTSTRGKWEYLSSMSVSRPYKEG